MAAEQSEIRFQFVHGHIKNAEPVPLDFMKSHDWFGHVVGKYPEIIKKNDSIHFEHDGTKGGPNGSKAAVIYTVPDPNERPNPNMQLSFLVAWWRSVRYAKAYVKIGSRTDFEKHFSWSEVEEKLNKSGEESTDFSPYFRTSATAKIGFDGKLEVVFGHLIGESS